ncbi:pilus assembly protein [Psychrobacter urativorans]|uniref:Type II secretion system protein H n=2 Tax=Psychrobacter urativorans TaxID=45610 RepID=A0A0M4T9N2_9GAMM|nr:pilus assembly protein [Psychrobacter urativorans]
MVTVAIMAIIVSIAAPNISTQLANQRVKGTTATLVNALKEAKVESVIRRQIVTVSFNNNGTGTGSIELKANSNAVATYRYDAKITIKATGDVKFKPNKTADEMTYTICDSNTAASPRQVSVSKLGNITSQLAGSCT